MEVSSMVQREKQKNKNGVGKKKNLCSLPSKWEQSLKAKG